MQKSPLIIHNIRLGTATNSSSSHSLIFLRKDQIGTIPERILAVWANSVGMISHLLLRSQVKIIWRLCSINHLRL